MYRHQLIMAACVLLVVALAGFRFIRDDSESLPGSMPFASQQNLSAAQRILLGQTIDINTADQQTLEVLPLIGPVLARRIIDDRAEKGPFSSIHDLARVYGVGPRIVERNSPYIAVK